MNHKKYKIWSIYSIQVYQLEKKEIKHQTEQVDFHNPLTELCFMVVET